MSVPEACSRTWADVRLIGLWIEGYERRKVRLSEAAYQALLVLMPERVDMSASVLTWHVDTARRHLKRLREVAAA